MYAEDTTPHTFNTIIAALHNLHDTYVLASILAAEPPNRCGAPALFSILLWWSGDRLCL